MLSLLFLDLSGVELSHTELLSLTPNRQSYGYVCKHIMCQLLAFPFYYKPQETNAI